jgi:perosamine synthetase
LTKKVIPYATQWLDDEDIDAVASALKSDWLTQGPRIKEFEDAFAGYCGARHAVAVSSGTAGLHIAAMAAGFGPGDCVITSPITFAASANCLLYCGARPVFCDVDPRTYCIDGNGLDASVNEKTRGIVPVHFAGQPCDMARIKEVADRDGLVVIEDAAHALGASYTHGGNSIKVGSCAQSDMTVFSFHPVKHITTGEGGMVTTNSPDLYRRLLQLRTHGITRDESLLEKKDEGPWYYEIQSLGFNYRITDFQCALGLSQLKKLDGFVKRRREIKQAYDDAFRGMDEIIVPFERDSVYSSWHLYVVQFKGLIRQDAFARLREKGLGVNVHYIPVYAMPFYRRLGYTDSCPEAETYYARAVSLPMYPKMSDEDVDYVIGAVKQTVEESRAGAS